MENNRRTAEPRDEISDQVPRIGHSPQKPRNGTTYSDLRERDLRQLLVDLEQDAWPTLRTQGETYQASVTRHGKRPERKE